MTSIAQKIIKPKLGLLELAKQLGNVSQACNVINLMLKIEYQSILKRQLLQLQ
jgi:hypothetical protein